MDARLTLYAQYAALVSDEVAAAWSADALRAGTVPRALAESRAALAEQYEELRQAHIAAGAASFGDAYSDAVIEMEHQAILDRALRDRVATLGAAPSHAALLATPMDAARPLHHPPPDDDHRSHDDLATLGGALVDARSAGVGGVLAGQFPGVAAGDPALYAIEAGGADDLAPHRLDVRF